MIFIPKVLLIIDFSEEYGRGILRGVAKYSQLFGPWAFRRMPFFDRKKGDMEKIIEFAKNWGANGIIAQIQNEQEVKKLLSLNIPVIAQDFKERFKDIPNITGKYIETGIMGANHFINRGFTKFAFYGFDDLVWSRERMDGFTQRVLEVGFGTHIYQHHKSEKPPLWSYTATPLAKWLKDLPKPLGLMACDDNQGQHVLEACKIAKINVPEQISILGVDNDEVICNLSDPPLSSISLNTEKGGYETALLLDKLMRGEKQEHTNIIVEPVEIVIRRSSDIFAIEEKELAKAVRFIYLNYKKNIGVDDVVAATALSRRVLEIKFADKLGKTILDEITELRIEHVSKMLTSTDLPIHEIAYLCGYSNEKNLSRYFKQRKDCTPLAFRKKFKN